MRRRGYGPRFLGYHLVMSTNITCIVCSSPLSGLQRKYCSKKCKSRAFNGSYQWQYARGLKRKLVAIELLGGGCERCGYSLNLAALVFHHIEPDKKLLALDMRAFSNNKQELLDVEIAKCLLLCHNCHAALHNPHLDMELL